MRVGGDEPRGDAPRVPGGADDADANRCSWSGAIYRNLPVARRRHGLGRGGTRAGDGRPTPPRPGTGAGLWRGCRGRRRRRAAPSRRRRPRRWRRRRRRRPRRAPGARAGVFGSSSTRGVDPCVLIGGCALIHRERASCQEVSACGARRPVAAHTSRTATRHGPRARRRRAPATRSRAAARELDRHLHRPRAMIDSRDAQPACIRRRRCHSSAWRRRRSRPPPACRRCPASERPRRRPREARGRCRRPRIRRRRSSTSTCGAASSRSSATARAPRRIGTVLVGRRPGPDVAVRSGRRTSGADVRYADGTTVHAKVERTDRSLDLALLAPDPVQVDGGAGRQRGGSRGARRPGDAPGARRLARPGARRPSWAGGRARARRRAALPDVDVDVQGAPVAGAPVLDPAGAVVAVLVRACSGAAGPDNGANAAVKVCQPVVLGAPVAAIRTFLSPLVSTMSAAAPAAATAAPASAPARPASPFLGIRGEPQVSGAVHGVRVAAVAPGEPRRRSGAQADERRDRRGRRAADRRGRGARRRDRQARSGRHA